MDKKDYTIEESKMIVEHCLERMRYWTELLKVHLDNIEKKTKEVKDEDSDSGV